MMHLTLFFIYRLILKVGDDVVASPALEKKTKERELFKVSIGALKGNSQSLLVSALRHQE